MGEETSRFTPEAAHFACLPDDLVQQEILPKLSATDLCALGIVSKRFKALAVRCFFP